MDEKNVEKGFWNKAIKQIFRGNKKNKKLPKKNQKVDRAGSSNSKDKNNTPQRDKTKSENKTMPIAEKPKTSTPKTTSKEPTKTPVKSDLSTPLKVDVKDAPYHSTIIDKYFKLNPDTKRYEIHKDWYLVKLLGQGAYGEVHEIVEIKTKERFAVKLDARSNQEIDREIQYLQKLNNTSAHVPQIVEYGRFSGVSYFVLTYLGASLSDLKKEQEDSKFSLSTTLRCARQMLTALRDVHNKGLIHRDIKPANFVIGVKDPRKVYIIDFGLASEYNLGQERTNIGFRGTNTYASVRVHQYRDPGRVDDLISWFYCMLRLLGVKFPWDKIKIPPKAEGCSSGTINTLYDRIRYVQIDRDVPTKDVPKDQKIAKLKRERKQIQDQFLHEKRKHPFDRLLKTAESKFQIPYQIFLPLCHHLDALRFNEEPNYKMLDGLFDVALKSLNIKESDLYDWEKKKN